MDEDREENDETVSEQKNENNGTDDGPGKEYEIYLKNEEFVDKLKLLNYENGFLKMGGAYKSIQRHYFVKSTNIGEQFFLFTSIATWLIRKCGDEEMAMPQEFDDPNSTISNIIGAAKNKGIPIDFAANRLKSGSGESVIYILNCLADAALVHVGFCWQRIIPPKEEDEDVNVDEQDPETDNEVEDDCANFENDIEDDENVIEIDLTSQGLTTLDVDAPLQGMLQSNTDVLTWRQEVDRVAPMLKISIRQDAKDWRLHVEQMNTMHANLGQKVAMVSPYLESMSKDVSKSLERIASREKTLNTQLSAMMNRFRGAQDKRAELREKYKAASVGVSSRTDTLQRISEDIEQLKQQIEEQGAKSNDGAPLVKIKQAVSRMEEELQRMNVQIGVFEQSIMNSYLRDRFTFNTDMLNIL